MPPAHTLPAAQGRVALQAAAGGGNRREPPLMVLAPPLPALLVLGRHLKQPSAASRPQTSALAQVRVHICRGGAGMNGVCPAWQGIRACSDMRCYVR